MWEFAGRSDLGIEEILVGAGDREFQKLSSDLRGYAQSGGRKRMVLWEFISGIFVFS